MYKNAIPSPLVYFLFQVLELLVASVVLFEYYHHFQAGNIISLATSFHFPFATVFVADHSGAHSRNCICMGRAKEGERNNSKALHLAVNLAVFAFSLFFSEATKDT